MSSIEDRSISFFETVTAEELAKKLLEPNFLSFLGDGHRDGIDVLGSIYPSLDSKIQDKISQALIKSADAWDPSVNSLSILKDVAFISGINRIEEVFPRMVKIVEEQFVSTGKTAEDNHDFMIIVSCISGSDTPEAREAVARWYEGESFDWKFYGIFCKSLIDQNPQNARTILPKFLKTMDEHPDHFVAGYLTSAMTQLIGPDELEEILNGFENKAAKVLLAEIPVAREIYEELKKEEKK
jgi:hypothetical protein